MSTLRGWVLAGWAAILFCGAAQPLAGDSASNTGEFAAVLAHNSCAPWDGPAVAFEFYTSPTRCGQAKSARLNINLWRDLPLKAEQKFELARGTTAGAASLCARENQCEAAVSGTVWIEDVRADKSVSGRYELVFQKAGRLAGKFRAEWCRTHELCR